MGVYNRVHGLINRNTSPNMNTRELMFTACPEARKIYESKFWDVLTPQELSKYQLLKIMIQLPHKFQRALRLENKNIRKRYTGFNLPKTINLRTIYQHFTVDAFATCFALFRYELKHKLPCPDIYQLYESCSLNLFVALMAQEPFYNFREYFIHHLKNELMHNLCSTDIESVVRKYSCAQINNTIKILNKNINRLKIIKKLKCKNDI